MKNSKYCLFISFFYACLAILIANKMYAFPSSLTALKFFETDGIFTQVQIQSFIDGAILGHTDHLGFPFGYSHWLSPQFSFLEGLLIWVLGNISPFTNYGLISIIGLTTIFCNSLSMHYLGLILTRNRVIAFTFGIIGIATPYALNSLMHPHVMKIFIIPLTLVFLIKLVNKEEIKLYFMGILLITILGSSLFWINVFLALFIVLISIQFIDVVFRKAKNDFLIYYIKVGFYIFIGFLFYSGLYFNNRNLMGDRDRLAWQSDLFSGKFTDVLLGSPFLNRYVSQLQNIVPGSSPETWAMMLGIPLMISFVIGVYFSISYISPILKNDLFSALKQISIVSVLFFVLGGLSNLQASFFVILGSASPMRTWSRLSILIAILGLCLFFLTFQLSASRTKFVAAPLLIFALVEIFSVNKLFDSKSNWSDQEMYGAVTFIEKQLEPCPVLQLPVDTYLLPQSALDQGYRYYWSGLVPYVALPEFNWTAAIYTNSVGWNEIEKLPSTITEETFSQISKTYCAVLFDKNFSQYQIDRKAGLNGNQGSWPGLRIDTETLPEFEDTRFSIFLLK